MKTLVIASIIATVAAPAFADTSFAVQHFNQDKDRASDRVVLQGADAVTVSTRGGILGGAIALFNGDEDRASDMVLAASATLVSGTAANGADIFAAIRAESLENE
jgi:hypothetical protein